MHTQRTIFLFGFGSQGRQLYQSLKQHGHAVTIVVTPHDEISTEERLDKNIKAIDIRKDKALQTLEIDPENDLIYCTISDRLENLFLVLSLRTLFPASHIIAFSSSEENSRKLQYAGATNVISMYESSANHIIHTLTKPAVTKAIEEIVYRQNDLYITEIKLADKTPLLGKYINQLELKNEGLILLAVIDRNTGTPMLMTDKAINHKLQAEDILVIIGREAALERLKQKIGASSQP